MFHTLLGERSAFPRVSPFLPFTLTYQEDYLGEIRTHRGKLKPATFYN